RRARSQCSAFPCRLHGYMVMCTWIGGLLRCRFLAEIKTGLLRSGTSLSIQLLVRSRARATFHLLVQHRLMVLPYRCFSRHQRQGVDLQKRSKPQQTAAASPSPSPSTSLSPSASLSLCLSPSPSLCPRPLCLIVH
ncbi:hypothetical protein LPJ75_002235, partial [Coemansia sp. RSA 2598]